MRSIKKAPTKATAMRSIKKSNAASNGASDLVLRVPKGQTYSPKMQTLPHRGGTPAIKKLSSTSGTGKLRSKKK